MTQYRGKINVLDWREENCRRNVPDLVIGGENYYIGRRVCLV